MSVLTIVTFLVIIFGLLGPKGYGYALALGGATAAGAAFVAGNTALPTFYATSLGAAVAVCVRLLGHGRSSPQNRQRLPPGVPLLLLFLGWSVVVTLIAPELFDGMKVLAPGGGPSRLASSTFTTSNIAQIIYLALGVCVVLFLARSRIAGPELIGLAAGVTTLLSLWRYLHQTSGLPFPEDLFDNSPAM